MHHIFKIKEIQIYQNWLSSRSGHVYLQASYQLLRRVLDLHLGWRILDIGCGLGYHLAFLHKKGILVHGIDIEPIIVRMASKKLREKIEIDTGDAHNLPYEDNSFDAVIMVNTLEFLEQPDQALAEATRVAINRICLITLNSLSFKGLWLRVNHIKYYPLGLRRTMTLWHLRRLIYKVLGPVPQTWAGAMLWPQVSVGLWPFADLIGLSAVVIPRYRTQPLAIKFVNNKYSTTRPIHDHG